MDELGSPGDDLRQAEVLGRERDPQPLVGQGADGRPLPLGGRETRADMHDVREFEQVTLDAVAVVLLLRGVRHAPRVVVVGPQGADDQHLGGQQRTDGRRCQAPVVGEVVLQLVEPDHHLPPSGRTLELTGVHRLHQPPVGHRVADRLVQRTGLSHRGTTHEQDEAAVFGSRRDQRTQSVAVPGVEVSWDVRRKGGSVCARHPDRPVHAEAQRIGVPYPQEWHLGCRPAVCASGVHGDRAVDLPDLEAVPADGRALHPVAVRRRYHPCLQVSRGRWTRCGRRRRRIRSGCCHRR